MEKKQTPAYEAPRLKVRLTKVHQPFMIGSTETLGEAESVAEKTTNDKNGYGWWWEQE